MSSEAKDIDALRDTYLRYFGYANEVGEAFRPLIPRSVVNFSYLAATTYVLADVYTKSIEKYKQTKDSKRTIKTTIDVLLWQSFASIIVPGLVINRITKLTSHLVSGAKKAPPAFRFIPTAVGLISIPFIITPIDNLVTYVMDKTYRAALQP